MGSLYGHQTEFSFESYSKLVTNSIDIGLYADFSAMKAVGVNVSLNFNYNKTKFDAWTKERTQETVYSFGAVPPGDDVLAWMGKTVEVNGEYMLYFPLILYKFDIKFSGPISFVYALTAIVYLAN